MSERLRPLTGRVAAAFLAVLLAAEAASACPVCFGNPDSPMAEGVNNGILVLLGFVGLVQIGFLALFVSIYLRARKLRQQREQFSIIDGGVN